MYHYFYQSDRIFFFTAIVILFITIGIVCLHHYQMHRMIERMNWMLEAAAKGEFSEKSFDETLLSSLESRLAGYLSASSVSSHNLKEEKEKIKELIADISHQTKTPITNILLYAQLLGEQELSKESKKCVKALCGQAEKLNFLIASLVKLSRLETGILVLYPVKNSLNSMLEEMKAQFAPKAEEKGIEFLIENTEEKAVFDKKWTAEALGNLIDNAIKYTPSGGRIQITVEAYELFCRIIVADTGIGIGEEEQAKIFGRFYRSQTVNDTEGVGIGLYVTRQILSEEGGYIKLSSAIGKGTKFSIYLPR